MNTTKRPSKSTNAYFETYIEEVGEKQRRLYIENNSPKDGSTAENAVYHEARDIKNKIIFNFEKSIDILYFNKESLGEIFYMLRKKPSTAEILSQLRMLKDKEVFYKLASEFITELVCICGLEDVDYIMSSVIDLIAWQYSDYLWEFDKEFYCT